MTHAQIAQITAAVIAALNSTKIPRKSRKYPSVAKREGYKPSNTSVELPVRQDRQIQRLAKVARGFERKGIKLEFDQVTGRFVNVKPYKTWLLEGRVVSKGQHGVSGLFHVSQTEVLPKEDAPVVPANFPVTKLPAESREHHMTHSA